MFLSLYGVFTTQDRPTGDEEPGIRPLLQHGAGEPEAKSAEVAVGDRRPLGLWTRLCPGGQTGATLQTTLQWTLMDLNGIFIHPDHFHKCEHTDLKEWKTVYLCFIFLYVNAAFTAQ